MLPTVTYSHAVSWSQEWNSVHHTHLYVTSAYTRCARGYIRQLSSSELCFGKVLLIKLFSYVVLYQ